MAWLGYRPKDGHAQYTDDASYSRGTARRTTRRPYFSRVIIWREIWHPRLVLWYDIFINCNWVFTRWQ